MEVSSLHKQEALEEENVDWLSNINVALVEY
jgi:hypothetical protein